MSWQIEKANWFLIMFKIKYMMLTFKFLKIHSYQQYCFLYMSNIRMTLLTKAVSMSNHWNWWIGIAKSVSSTLAGDKPANKTKSLSSQVDEYLKKVNGVDDPKTLRLLELTEQTLRDLEKRVVGKNENTNDKTINALNQMINIIKKIQDLLIKLKKNDTRNFKIYADTLWNNSINTQMFNFNNSNATRENLWQTLNTKIMMIK